MDLSRVPQKLKVVHIASGDRWAGAEVQLYTLLTQLNKNDGIQPSAILMNDGELARRLREQHIRVDVLDESQYSTLTIFRKLIKLLREISPDIVHTHRQKENILGSLANFFSSRAASVRTVHGAPEHGAQSIPQKVIDALDRWTGNHLQQRIIAVSDDLATKLKDRFKPEHISIIENGVDVEAIRAAVGHAAFRHKNPTAAHIGIVGRLDPVKRIDIFLQMAQQLSTVRGDRPWQFHIIGEGALKTSLQSQAHTLGIHEKVEFHGHRADVASCLAELDVLVMCSDHEGLPMTILEAIVLGTPIVAHNVGGLKKLLADGAGGTLVQTHTAEAYAHEVIHILTTNRAERYTRSLHKINTKYSAAINEKSISALYFSLATGRAIRQCAH